MVVLLGILMASFALRLPGVFHAPGTHPDERHMVMVTQTLSLHDLNPHSFAYGSVPYYLGFFVSRGLGVVWPYLQSYDGIFLVGRVICVLMGVIGVFLAYLLAMALRDDPLTAVIAAFLLGFNFFHIQLSRFFTSDVILTTSAELAVWLCLSIAKGGKHRLVLLAGAVVGVALATKIAAVYLVVPLALALFIGQRNWFYRFGSFISALVVAGVCFAICSPYAILDWHEFLRQNLEQIHMVRGDWRPPYTVQYVDTPPFLYPLKQIAFFTSELTTLLAVLMGFGLAADEIYHKRGALHALLLGYALIFFVLTAGLTVKFPRYLLPLYPVGAVYAGMFLSFLVRGERDLENELSFERRSLNKVFPRASDPSEAQLKEVCL